jgi:hypothetical protein
MSLLTDLISVWELDEASGNAVDAHGSNTAAANNAPGSAAGQVGNSRTFNGSNQSFVLAANSSVEMGDIDFSLAGWVYLSSGAANRVVAGKWRFTGGNWRQYAIEFVTATNRLTFGVTHDGNAVARVSADNYGNIPLDTWVYVTAGHNASTNELWVSVNGGTPNTLAHSTGVFSDANADFYIGAYNQGASNLWNGRLDQIALWKRDIRSDVSDLYNGGSGLAYSSWAGGTFKPFWRRPQTQMIGGGTR